MSAITIYNTDGSVHKQIDNFSNETCSVTKCFGIYCIKNGDSKDLTHTNLSFHMYEKLSEKHYWFKDEGDHYYDVTLLSNNGKVISKWKAIGDDFVNVYEDMIAFYTKEGEGDYTMHHIAGSFFIEGIRDRWAK